MANNQKFRVFTNALAVIVSIYETGAGEVFIIAGPGLEYE